MTHLEIAAAQARTEVAAEALGLTHQPPRTILAPDGAPDARLLAWAARHGVSLDWIFRGDTKTLLRYTQRQLKGSE